MKQSKQSPDQQQQLVPQSSPVNSNQGPVTAGQALTATAIASSAKVNQTSSMQRFGDPQAHPNIRKVQPSNTVNYSGQNSGGPLQMTAVGHSTGSIDQRQNTSNQKGHAGIKYQTADPKGMTMNNSGNLGRVPLSQRGQRQQNNNIGVHGKFVGNQTVQPNDPSPNKSNFANGSATQTHPQSNTNRRQGQRKQLVAQSLNIRNQYGQIGGQQQFFAGNVDKATIHQYGPIVNRGNASNHGRLVPDTPHGVGMQTTREKNRTGGLSHSTQPTNPYITNSLQGNGQTAYHPLRHVEGQNAFGSQKPNSKKHNRTLSNDDRVMEVEGFNDAQNNMGGAGSTFQNKSNSIRNENDPHGWAGHDQGHHKGSMSYDQNGMPVSNYELAASKPLNSSRGLMNRRFQKHQGMNMSDHQRQVSSNSGQANLPQYGSSSFTDGPSNNQLYSRDGVSAQNQNKKQMMKTGQNFASGMQGTVNRSLNMNYQRSNDQANNSNQQNSGNIHYQNADFLQQSYPSSSQQNQNNSTHRMLRPKTGENVGNSQTAQNAGLSVFANRQSRANQGAQGQNQISQTLQANSTKRINNLKQSYQQNNAAQENDKNYSRGSRQYQGYKGNDKTQRGDSINSYGPTSGPPLSPPSAGGKQFFTSQHSANSQQRSATSGHGRMVLNPVNNSYNSQNAQGFNPNKLIGGHKQNLLGNSQGAHYPHNNLQNPKSHRGELYQGNRPISHGDTIQGIGKQNQMQSSGNMVHRGHNQIQNSADFKSQKQWANSQGDIATAASQGAQRDLSSNQNQTSASQDNGRINISINKYKDKRQQRFNNQQPLNQQSMEKASIDQANMSDQQRLMNRAEFNKSHDYKRKTDKNRLEVGRISQGHPEDYDTLGGASANQLNKMGSTHYQNNLIPKDMLGQQNGPHTINMHNNSPQSSIQQVQLQRKLVNTQGRKQRVEKSQEPIGQQQRIPSKSPIRPIGTAAPTNDPRLAPTQGQMQSSRKKTDQDALQQHQQNTMDNSPNKGHDTQQKQKRHANDQQVNSQKLGNQLPVKITSERFNCITKFAFATSVGHQPGNPNKPNQDAYVLVPNMLSQLGLHFFSVCDGHGVNGHHVSAFIKENLPLYIEKQLAQDKLYKSNSRITEFYDRIPKQMHNAFIQVHQDLGKLNFDTELSGSTCVAILFDRNTIFSANAGDSRGVLYSYDRVQSGIKITPLSKDHKPCMPVEKKRVLSVGGRVDTIKGSLGQNLGPMRVWLMEQDAPGLAMSRSLGDYIAHSVGVSSDPEVMRFELQPEDKFIIIASDGVWEFLSNEMIAKIVWPFYLKNSPEQAGNAIVRAAASKWRENDTVIDDITCVTIFLEVDHQIPKIETAVYKKALINSSTEFPVNTSQQQSPAEKQINTARQSPQAPKQVVKKRTNQTNNQGESPAGNQEPQSSQPNPNQIQVGNQRSPKPPATIGSARNKPKN